MQYPTQTLIPVRNILASLYQTAGDARRVASDAGLDTTRIAITDKSIDSWFNILNEANARYKVDALVKQALQDYGENEQLKHALDGATAAAPDRYELDDGDEAHRDALEYLELFDRIVENTSIDRGLRAYEAPPAIAPLVFGILAEPADEYDYFVKRASAEHLGRFLGATGASQDGEIVVWGDDSTTAEDDLREFAKDILGDGVRKLTTAAVQTELGARLAGRVTRLGLSTEDLAQPGTAAKLGQFLALWSGLGPRQPQPILCVVVVRSYDAYPSVEQSESILSAVFAQATGLTMVKPVKLSKCELKHFEGWERDIRRLGRKFDVRNYPKFKQQFEQAPFRLRKLKDALQDLKDPIYL